MRILQGQYKHHFTRNYDHNPIDTIYIAGVLDIVKDFDVILFSANHTISNDNMILPSGCVLVPNLRKKGKTLSVFSVEPDHDRQDLTLYVNRVGLSFSTHEILLLEDFQNLNVKFPFTPPHRILMVCSNLIEEVSLGKSFQVTTLLIEPNHKDQSALFGIWPHYIAPSV